MTVYSKPMPVVIGNPVDYNLLQSFVKSIESVESQVPRVFMDNLSNASAGGTAPTTNSTKYRPIIVSGILNVVEGKTEDGHVDIVVKYPVLFHSAAPPIITYSIWSKMSEKPGMGGSVVYSVIIAADKSSFTIRCMQPGLTGNQQINIGSVMYHLIGW